MKKLTTTAAIALASLMTISTAVAQNNQDDDDKKDSSVETRTRFWEANVNGGNYMVALNRITSISKHSYMVGNLVITEVVIDTDGNSLVRFYAADTAGSNADANILKNTTNRLKELTREKGAQAGITGTPVVKDYPNTTHAKTVEFNVETSGTLNSIYNSVKRAWERNRGARFTSK